MAVADKLRRDSTRRGAFTLMELMIALGILAVGVSMAAAIFPLAIRSQIDAFDSSVGGIICRNALSVASVAVPAGAVTSSSLSVIADESHTSVLSLSDQHYPTAGSGTLGFVLLGRKTSDGTSRQLVAVAYRKRSGGQVTAKLITCDVQAKSKNITGATGLRVGSPLIDAVSGRYAMIVSTNDTGTAGTLDRRISYTDVTTSAFVIVESTETRLSPAINILTGRTALR